MSDSGSWQLGGEASVSSDNAKKRKGGIFILPLLTLAILLIGLAAVFLYYRYLAPKSFPELTPGIYVGTMTDSPHSGMSRDWILRISDDFKTIEAIFVDQDNDILALEREPSGYLSYQRSGQRVLLKGAASSSTQGTFEVIDSSRKGLWYLSQLLPSNTEADQAFRHWMLLRSELAQVEQDIDIAQKLLPSQKLEIDTLSQVLTDEGAMKERASSRLNQLRQEQVSVRLQLEKKRQDVQKAQAQVALAQKLSAAGKLVNLARETDEREARWVRSLLVGSESAIGSDIEQAFRRAEEVRGLKQALELERQIVNQLASQFDVKGNQ